MHTCATYLRIPAVYTSAHLCTPVHTCAHVRMRVQGVHTFAPICHTCAHLCRTCAHLCTPLCTPVHTFGHVSATPVHTFDLRRVHTSFRIYLFIGLQHCECEHNLRTAPLARYPENVDFSGNSATLRYLSLSQNTT